MFGTGSNAKDGVRGLDSSEKVDTYRSGQVALLKTTEVCNTCQTTREFDF